MNSEVAVTESGIRVDTGVVSGVLPFGEGDGGWTAAGVLQSRSGGVFPIVVSAPRLQVMLVNVFRELGRVEMLADLEGNDV